MMDLRQALRLAASCTAAGLVLCGCNLGQTQSAILVDKDSTSGTTQSTSPFTVTGPWQIKYTFDCTKENAEGVVDANQFTIDVFNGDDNSTAFEHPQTTFISVKRRGTLDFTTPGDYYLHVDTQCDWTLQVVDLSSGTVVSTSSAPRVARPHGTVHFDLRFAAVDGFYSCDLTGTAAARCVVVDGTAGSSPFGPLSMHRTMAIQPGAADCVAATTSGTLTSAAGDTLTVTADKGQGCQRSLSSSFSFTVTGGTGIFKGATGSGTIAGRSGSADHWSGSITFAK